MLRWRLRSVALAACVTLAAAFAGTPVGAVEAPPGSTNFTPPRDVPNYFSNESGPFQGAAGARSAQPGAVPGIAAPAPHRALAVAESRHARHHLGRGAKARGRVRLARGRAAAHRHVVHAYAARRGTASGPRALHAQPRLAGSKAVAIRSRPAPGRAGRVARAGR